TGQLLIYVLLVVFLLIMLFFCVIYVLIVKFLSLLYCCDSLVIWSRMRQKMLLLLVITSADAFLKCSCNGIKTTLRSGWAKWGFINKHYIMLSAYELQTQVGKHLFEMEVLALKLLELFYIRSFHTVVP
ncbi:hypothetical protein OM223_16445, partial [Escherichia albertii]|nr:hypothetical protein [Escherichia albertii]